MAGVHHAYQVALRRLRNQRLTGEPFASVVEAVGALGAVQSQDFAAAKWAVAQRTRASTEADLDALFDAGALLRTHVMRPTWHFVLPEDIAWLLELTAPRVKAQMTYHDRTVGVDAALLARAYATFESCLEEPAARRTRSELSAELERAGIHATNQRLGNLLVHAELDGIIVSGPRRGKQHTYALLAHRAPNARRLERDQALAELTLRYFTSHGPAQVMDFVWWSGLTSGDARRGLEIVGSALERHVVVDTVYWSGPAQAMTPSAPIVRLLPNFDEFLVAYRDRSASLQGAMHLLPAEVLSNVVTFDGQVRGSWKLRRQSGEAAITVNLHHPNDLEAIQKAVCALGRYLGVNVRLTY